MKKMTTFYSPGSGDRLKIIESTAECEAYHLKTKRRSSRDTESLFPTGLCSGREEMQITWSY